MRWSKPSVPGFWYHDHTNTQGPDGYTYMVYCISEPDPDGAYYVFINPDTEEIIHEFSSKEWNAAYTEVRARIQKEEGVAKWDRMWEDDTEYDAIMDYWISTGRAIPPIADPFTTDDQFVDSF